MLCSRRGTRTPICSVSSTDRARILLRVASFGGRLRSSSPYPDLPNPRLLPCCLSAMLCLSSLSVCIVQVAACASTSTFDMHGIDTTIPANKGAEGAVSVRERAVNEAALCVSLVCLMVCLCVVVFRGAAPPLPRPFCHCSRSLFLYARMAGFRRSLRGGHMPP